MQNRFRARLAGRWKHLSGLQHDRMRFGGLECGAHMTRAVARPCRCCGCRTAEKPPDEGKTQKASHYGSRRNIRCLRFEKEELISPFESSMSAECRHKITIHSFVISCKILVMASHQLSIQSGKPVMRWRSVIWGRSDRWISIKCSPNLDKNASKLKKRFLL
jgi:hypothetical protein